MSDKILSFPTKEDCEAYISLNGVRGFPHQSNAIETMDRWIVIVLMQQAPLYALLEGGTQMVLLADW